VTAAPSSRLDLLFLTQTYPRFEEDTAAPFLRDLARALVRGGDRVTVVLPRGEGLMLNGVGQDGVEVIPFPYAPPSWEVLGYGRTLAADERVRGKAMVVTPLYLLAARRAVRKLLARRRFDLVHAHFLVPNGVAVAPLPTPAKGTTTLAVGLHGSDVFLAEKRGARTLARFALQRTALLTGCSPELVSRVCALGFPAERSRVIPYGVDVRAFTPRGPDSGGAGWRDWREKLAIPPAAPLLLGVGRMATKKGFQVLLETLPRLFAARPDAHVVLAGGGDRLAEFTAAAAAAAPWADRVHFPGPVLRDTLPDLYRAADVFVLPAVHDTRGNVDGLPNVILEAMASGLPVVASGISGIPLAVEPERTGLLVPEGDADALGTALLRLLAEPDLARAMGESGRRKAESELTWEAVAVRYRDGYLAALGQGRD
jgi:glycosyltransferase involved in cell wall biosynthesis